MSGGDNNKTTNYLQITSQLVMQILTSETFRTRLQAAKAEDRLLVEKILEENGYSKELAEAVEKLDFEALKKSRIFEIMPDDVELMTMGGYNINW